MIIASIFGWLVVYSKACLHRVIVMVSIKKEGTSCLKLGFHWRVPCVQFKLFHWGCWLYLNIKVCSMSTSQTTERIAELMNAKCVYLASLYAANIIHM